MMRTARIRVVLGIEALCAAVPLGMAVVFSLVCLFDGWQWIFPGHDHGYYLLPAMRGGPFALMFWALMVWLGWKIARRTLRSCGEGRRADLSCALAVFLTAALVRSIFVLVFYRHMPLFSDFQRVWGIACGDPEWIAHYRLAVTYLNFSVFESWMARIFGEDYRILFFLNALFSSLTASVVFLLARSLGADRRRSLTAGLLYASIPADILFCLTGAPDFLVILLDTLGALCLSRTLRTGDMAGYGNGGGSVPLLYAWKTVGRPLVWALLGGILVGTGSAYKTFGSIILIAFSMVLILAERPEAPETAAVPAGRSRRARILIAAMCVLLCFGAYRSMRTIILHHTEEVYGSDLDYDSLLPHSLLTGLNTQSEGQIHVGDLSMAYQMEYKRNGYDWRAAAQKSYQILKEDLSEHRSEIAPDLFRKMIWAWQDDGIPVHYFQRYGILVFLNAVPGEDVDTISGSDGPVMDFQDEESAPAMGTVLARILYDVILGTGGAVSQVHYIALMSLAAAAVLLSVRRRRADALSFFPPLVVFGYFCMIFLAEGQSRYKILIMPWLCILASLGALRVWERIRPWGAAHREDWDRLLHTDIGDLWKKRTKGVRDR